MALPALRHDAERPAGIDGVKSVVGSRFATFTPPDLSEAEWAAWWRDMNNACGEFPLARLEAGMQAYINGGAEFLPKAGVLRQHVEAAAYTALSKAEVAYARARAAVRHRAEEDKRNAPRPDPALIKAQLAETLERLTSKDRLRAAAQQAARRQTPSAPLPAGSAMSAEMRAMLEARKVIPPIDRDPYQYGEAA